MKQETVIAHCLLSIIAVGSVMPSVRKNVISAATPAEAVLTDRLQGHKKDRRSLTPVSFTFIYPSFQVLFQSVVVDVIPLDVVEILLKNSHKFLFHNVTPLSVRRDFFRSLRTSSVIHQTPPPVPPNGNKKWSNLLMMLLKIFIKRRIKIGRNIYGTECFEHFLIWILTMPS